MNYYVTDGVDGHLVKSVTVVPLMFIVTRFLLNLGRRYLLVYNATLVVFAMGLSFVVCCLRNEMAGMLVGMVPLAIGSVYRSEQRSEVPFEQDAVNKSRKSATRIGPAKQQLPRKILGNIRVTDKMFVDRVDIYCEAGDGGDGCVSFRREAHVPRGGPDGGDGGDGGSVIIRAERNLGSLQNIAGHAHWKAERGVHGMGSLKTGRNGKSVEVLVPPGTLVLEQDTDDLIQDLAEDGASIIIARGGRGGRGNKYFATATNRTPREFEKGEPGEKRHVTLELKLIADVGVIGKPNAGKSTLLSRISQATPEIANYPFTTKYPNLGVVPVGEDRHFVMADIPGLIEGAHAGIGLGHEFLKHVQRTKVLVHLVEPSPMDQSDPIDNYRQICEEMRLFDQTLAERPELVAVSKCELPDAEPTAELLQEATGCDPILISAATGCRPTPTCWSDRVIARRGRSVGRSMLRPEIAVRLLVIFPQSAWQSRYADGETRTRRGP